MKLSEYFPLTSYEQLIRVVSVGHGSHLWVQNFDRLVQNGTVSPRDVFTCCEELQRLLQNAGMDADEAESLTRGGSFLQWCRRSGSSHGTEAARTRTAGLAAGFAAPDSQSALSGIRDRRGGYPLPIDLVLSARPAAVPENCTVRREREEVQT